MVDPAEASVIVGLDFGTTFSGFAYAHAANAGSILTFYDWPSQSRGGGKPYCKTQTSLYYLRKGDAVSPRYELVNWGWPAQLERARAGEREDGFFVTRFKLHLAPGSESLVAEAGDGSKSSEKKRRTTRSSTREDRSGGLLNALPPGITSERVVSDYLLKISDFALKHLQCTYGAHITSQDVQWCITVPAIWDNGAKEKMKKCAQRAGMVVGPHCPDALAGSASRHPIVIVLESEAASVYCANKSKELNLEKGAQFLVADVGGGTVDIVVHSKENGEGSCLRLKEVRHSEGGLCGGSHVDNNFLKFMSEKIGCFNSFAEENPGIITQFLRTWEDIKGAYDPWSGCQCDDVEFEIPSKLSKAWKSHVLEQSRGRNKEDGLDFEQVILTSTDMRSIFDPVVEQVVDLIKRQMTPEITVMMLVGGFSASPYLRARLRLCFKGHQIITPPDPGSAVCQGAVILGFAPEIVMSRISRKTYGLQVSDLFRHGIDPPETMQRESVSQHMVCWCCSRFMTFVRKGQEIATDECVSHSLSPTIEGMKEVVLNIYSYSKQPEPEYVTQPGVKLEGTFALDISHDPENMNLSRRFEVSMYFGKSCIQVKAQRKNFGDTEEVIEMFESFAFDYDMLESH